MTFTACIDDDLRETIISKPSVILDDPDLMRALIAANETAMGANIVDLRGIAMERLETRLDRLEDTHRSVIAAAYENLAGTNQVHRAILSMLEPASFDGFLANLSQDVASTLRLDAVHLVLEADDQDAQSAFGSEASDVLTLAEPGFIARYLDESRTGTPRPVTLRQITGGHPVVYGARADRIQSEACLWLDFGQNRQPGLLALGSEDPHMFNAQQAGDLLAFFGGVFERAMRRWLA